MFLKLLLAASMLALLSTCKKKADTASCSDGIQNQNETGIDCGGECTPCITCNDGIQNQGETDIDCGGPCGACNVSYPAKTKYGPNILRLDTITLKGSVTTPSTNLHLYSISANLSNGSTLKVRFTKIGGHDPCSFTINGSSLENWSYSPLGSQGTIQLLAAANRNCDMQIYFCGTEPLKVEYFLNESTTPYRTKTLSWTN